MLPTVPPGYVSTQFANVYQPYYGFFGYGGTVSTYPYNVFNPTVTPEQARAATSTFIPDQRLPYTMQWNANLQQTMGRLLLDIGYLGVRGRNLPVQNVLNETARVTATSSLPLFYTTINPNAQFVAGAPGLFVSQGGRNYIRTNPINDFDASITKRFAVRDRFSLELRGDAMNVLNHPQYTPGNTSQLGLGAMPNFSFLTPGNAAFGNMSSAFCTRARFRRVCGSCSD